MGAQLTEFFPGYTFSVIGLAGIFFCSSLPNVRSGTKFLTPIRGMIPPSRTYIGSAYGASLRLEATRAMSEFQ